MHTKRGLKSAPGSIESINNHILHMKRPLISAMLLLCTPLTQATQPPSLAQAVANNDLERVRMLIQNGEDVNASEDDSAFPPIIEAARSNNAQALQLLLEAGANPNLAREEGDTALHHAVLYGAVDCVKLLIAAGADIEAREISDSTPLDLALLQEEDDTAELRQRKEECARLLQEAGATPSATEETPAQLPEKAPQVSDEELEEQRALLKEYAQTLQAIIQTTKGINNKETADAAAPIISQLREEALRLSSQIHLYNLPELKELRERADAFAAEAQAEVSRIGEARLYGSVKLAKASGYGAYIIRDHENTMPEEVRNRLSAALLARYQQMASEFPHISGGPGLSEETAWRVTDSSTTTQRALVEQLFASVVEEADFIRTLTRTSPEKQLVQLAFSFRFEGKYYMHHLFVEIVNNTKESGEAEAE